MNRFNNLVVGLVVGWGQACLIPQKQSYSLAFWSTFCSSRRANRSCLEAACARSACSRRWSISCSRPRTCPWTANVSGWCEFCYSCEFDCQCVEFWRVHFLLLLLYIFAYSLIINQVLFPAMWQNLNWILFYWLSFSFSKADLFDAKLTSLSPTRANSSAD